MCVVGNDISIVGSYFGSAVITFEGNSVVVRFLSSSSIQLTLPKASSGDQTIRITTPYGTTSTVIKYLDEPKPSFGPTAIPYLSQGDFIKLPISAQYARSYAVIGNLPSGLSLDSKTGLISGTPNENGIFSFFIKAIGICGDTIQLIELDIDKETPNAISHRVNILPGASCINDSAKASLLEFLDKVKAISPRNLIPEIYLSGGGIGGRGILGDERRDCLCDLFLEESVYGNIIEAEFTGSANRIEIIVYWAKP